MKISERDVPDLILAQKVSRRTVLATGLKIATIGGTATLGAAALNAGSIFPVKASGSVLTRVSPAATHAQGSTPIPGGGTTYWGGWYLVP